MRALLLLLLLATCEWRVPPKETCIKAENPTSDPTTPEDVRRWLMTNPGVSAVERHGDAWEIIASSDGRSRDALAAELCRRLADHGFATPGLEIRVRDGAARDHILGRARCAIFPARS